jgi:hypothetical protein
MTNIWADSYKEIRKPFFDTESLEEERAKRDYDEDGKLESGAKEYRGAVHNAIQKKKGGKPDGQDTSSVKEEVEEIDEELTGERLSRAETKMKSLGRRKSTLASRVALNRVSRGQEGTGVQGGENAPVKRGGGGTAGMAKVSGTGGDDMDRGYGNKAKRRAAALKNEETLVEVEKKHDSKDKKIDVMSGKNKIAINPQIKEEVEAWVSELVEEGYDLSEFTWEEMTDIYLDEMSEGTAGMPARGDAETVSVTNPQLASAKRRAAQTQIAADMARIKLQRTSAMTKESCDSIVEYLSQRNDAFENLEEGVFDPKKSKMRPASERTKNTMTDAQRAAARKEAARTAEIHSKGETVLAGMRSQGKRGKVKTTPDAKPAAPAANRTVKGRYDKLAKAASAVLKSAQK